VFQNGGTDQKPADREDARQAGSAGKKLANVLWLEENDPEGAAFEYDALV
jgi:hypothetical protein